MMIRRANEGTKGLIAGSDLVLYVNFTSIYILATTLISIYPLVHLSPSQVEVLDNIQ